MKMFIAGLIIFLAMFNVVCLLNAESSQEYYQAGLNLSREEKWSEAIEKLRQAYQIDPKDGKICLALGLTLQRSGDTGQALIYLKKSLEINPKSVAPYFSLALIYEKRKNYSLAINCWEEFLNLSDHEHLKNIARKHLKYLRDLNK
ncbi:MAG: tetratricopeptide repeat protein [Elusimicrobiota bacterium]